MKLIINTRVIMQARRSVNLFLPLVAGSAASCSIAGGVFCGET